MPREGISLGQVQDVIDQLEADGTKPTYRRIRAKLGEGSLTTIANHFKTIAKQRDSDGSEFSTRIQLPDPVLQALTTSAEATWSELLGAADEIATQAQQRAAREAELAQQAAETARARQAEAEADRDGAWQALNEEKAGHAETQRTLEALQAELHESERRLIAAETASEGQRLLIDELKRIMAGHEAALARSDRQLEQAHETLANRELTHHDAVKELESQWAVERDRLSAERDAMRQHAEQYSANVRAAETALERQAVVLAGERAAATATDRRWAEDMTAIRLRLQTRTEERDAARQQVGQLEAQGSDILALHRLEREQHREQLAAKDEQIEQHLAALARLTDAVSTGVRRPGRVQADIGRPDSGGGEGEGQLPLLSDHDP